MPLNIINSDLICKKIVLSQCYNTRPEGAALDVLSGQADVDAVLEEGAERESLPHRPVRLPLLPHLVPALQDALQACSRQRTASRPLSCTASRPRRHKNQPRGDTIRAELLTRLYFFDNFPKYFFFPSIFFSITHMLVTDLR